MDYYRLDLTGHAGPTNVVVELSPLPKLDMAFALYEVSAEGKPGLLEKVGRAPEAEKEYTLKELVPGTYLIKVWGKPRGESNAADSYRLSITRPR